MAGFDKVVSSYSEAMAGLKTAIPSSQVALVCVVFQKA